MNEMPKYIFELLTAKCRHDLMAGFLYMMMDDGQGDQERQGHTHVESQHRAWLCESLLFVQ